MAWFKKKPDPFSDRARILSEEIAALETQIKELDEQLQQSEPPPRLRSTALPHGGTLSYPPAEPAPAPAGRPQDPIFEDLGRDLLKGKAEGGSTPEHYNELGVRKYDLPALWRRARQHLRGPATTNPKLVSYLAAGGLQGLRPLRYEKRVARNRFIAFVIVLFLVLLGTIWVFLKRR